MIEVRAGFGTAVTLRHAQKLRVSTPSGQQAADFWAFSPDMQEWLSAMHTWARTNVVKPRQGDVLLSQLRKPMLAFVRDGARGVHDMHIPACDPRRYEEFGLREPHRSCADNLVEALAELGQEPPLIPQPINFFTNTRITERQELVLGDPEDNPVEPGSFVVVEALRELICVVSSCPFDLPVPGWSLTSQGATDLHLQVIDA